MYLNFSNRSRVVMAGRIYHLKMKAKLKEVDELAPKFGPGDEGITYYFKVNVLSLIFSI